MSKPNYVKMFDLTPDERTLHILICAKGLEAETSLPKVTFLEANQLQPALSFKAQSFDLVLCPNILFSEEEPQDAEFHRAVLRELTRIGSEVRVFPLVNEQGQPAHYLGLVIQSLQDEGYGVEVRQITSDVQNAVPNAMLRLWNTACLIRP